MKVRFVLKAEESPTPDALREYEASVVGATVGNNNGTVEAVLILSNGNILSVSGEPARVREWAKMVRGMCGVPE